MNITYLAGHEEVIPTLAEWFYREWSYLQPNRTLSDVESSIRERVNKDVLPVALLAFEGSILVGTICLRTHDMDTRLDLSPWLAGLYVAESWRGRGIGTEMVNAIEQTASTLGIRKLYLYTLRAEPFYSRMVWQVKETTEYHGAKVTIMEKILTL